MKQKGELLRPSLIHEADQGGVREAGRLTGLEVHLATLGWLQFKDRKDPSGAGRRVFCAGLSSGSGGDGAPGCRGRPSQSLSTAYGLPRGRNHVSHAPCVCFLLAYGQHSVYFQI